MHKAYSVIYKIDRVTWSLSQRKKYTDGLSVPINIFIVWSWTTALHNILNNTSNTLCLQVYISSVLGTTDKQYTKCNHMSIRILVAMSLEIITGIDNTRIKPWEWYWGVMMYPVIVGWIVHSAIYLVPTYIILSLSMN